MEQVLWNSSKASCGCYSVTFLNHTFLDYVLMGVWLGEDQRTNTISTHVYKRLDYAFKFDQLLHPTVNTTGLGGPAMYSAKHFQ